MDDGGVVARLERVERAVEGGPRAAPAPQAAPVREAPARPGPRRPRRGARRCARARAEGAGTSTVRPKAPEPAPSAREGAGTHRCRAAGARTRRAARRGSGPRTRRAARRGTGPSADAAAPPAAAPPAAEAEMVRRRWPEVLQTLRGLRMASWALVSQNAQVASVEADVVRLAFTTPQLAQTFRTGPHAEHVRRALHETLGLDVRVEPVLAPSGGDPGPRAAGAPGTPTREQAEASWSAPARQAQGAASDRPQRQAPASGPADAARPTAGPAGRAVPPRRAPEARPAGPPLASDGVPDAPEPDEEPEPPEPGPAPARQSAPGPDQGRAKPASAPSRPRSAPPQRPSRPAAPAPDDGSDASPDDPELVGSGLVGAPLVAQMLGGTVIDEIPDEPQ